MGFVAINSLAVVHEVTLNLANAHHLFFFGSSRLDWKSVRNLLVEKAVPQTYHAITTWQTKKSAERKVAICLCTPCSPLFTRCIPCFCESCHLSLHTLLPPLFTRCIPCFCDLGIEKSSLKSGTFSFSIPEENGSLNMWCRNYLGSLSSLDASLRIGSDGLERPQCFRLSFWAPPHVTTNTRKRLTGDKTISLGYVPVWGSWAGCNLSLSLGQHGVFTYAVSKRWHIEGRIPWRNPRHLLSNNSFSFKTAKTHQPILVNIPQ